MAGRILMLCREVLPQGRRALERFASARVVEEGIAHGQEDLVDVKPHEVKIPFSSLAAVGSWLRETLSGEPVPVSVPNATRPWGEGRRGPDRRTHPLARSAGLFGIVTEPGRRVKPTARTVRPPCSSMPGPSATPAPPASGRPVSSVGRARIAIAALRPQRSRRQPGQARSGSRRMVSSRGARRRPTGGRSSLTSGSVRRRAGRALFRRLPRD